MGKMADLVAEIEAGPAPGAVAAFLDVVLGGARVSLEVEDSPVYRVLDLALTRGDALDEATLRAADDLARDVVRYHDRLHPPAADDDTAWLWHGVAARVAARLGETRRAWDFAARVLAHRPDLEAHLGEVHEEEGYAAWAGSAPGHFPWRHLGEGHLEWSLPVGEPRFTHAVASTMELEGLVTLAAYRVDAAAVPAPAVHLLATPDEALALCDRWGVRREELVGQVWRSPQDDPGDAMALLLADVRRSAVERVSRRLAAAVAARFGDADLAQIFGADALALAQAVVTVGNSGTRAVCASWVQALGEAVGALSDGEVEVLLAEGYPWEEPGVVLTFVRDAECFHLALSHAGSVGATGVGPVDAE